MPKNKGFEDLDFKQVDMSSPTLMTAQVRMRDRGDLIMDHAELAVHDIAEKLQWIVLYSSDDTSRNQATKAYKEISELKAGLVELREERERIARRRGLQ